MERKKRLLEKARDTMAQNGPGLQEKWLTGLARRFWG